MSDRFIAHMLARNSRIGEDLIDQHLESSGKWLPRTLWLLPHDENREATSVTMRASQEMVAEMRATRRSRLDFFRNHRKNLGLTEGSPASSAHRRSLSIVLYG
jgi:CRP/FNR family cyclic AMP-dependent transcriptional regulator